MGKLIDITETIAWRNFRKRCNIKDIVEQREVNKDLLRYIERLEKQIVNLHDRINKLECELVKLQLFEEVEKNG